MATPLDSTPVEELKGIGPALATKLHKIGIASLQDILFHLPLRYEDRTRVTPIGAAQAGTQVVLEGEVIACDISHGRRRSLLAYLEDTTGRMALRFFHFSRAQQNNLANAGRIRCFGEVRRGAAGLEIYHPEYTRISNATPLPDHLTPVYPTTEGISQQKIREMVARVLAMMEKGQALSELIAEHYRYQGIEINDAIQLVHRPPTDANTDQLLAGTHPALQRLAFEELLAHQISLRLIRETIQSKKGHPLRAPLADYQSLKDGLGFELTAAQRRVLAEVADDMCKPVPMLRLLQGDVGSGKTVVAGLASVHARENDLQTAVMAPTEILAEQHFINFSQWLAPLGITTAWLSGKVKGKKRNEQLALIASGNADVVIGTHALFQDDVEFKRLGLMIIDEQHRFGVHQRLALREKGQKENFLPHQLVMTATPIPRTLTMSLYADMETSVIDELPPGRSPVTTSIIADSRRDEVVERVKSACSSGAQAYWVCTLIEESEALQCQAAEATAAQLVEQLPELNVGLIHGRMHAGEKTRIMAEFKAGKINLLVATTVIEVGVDVPNATLMIIENPERLGLAQLHQLRGRIGRGSAQSHCVLLYHAPLGQISKQRLNVLRESTDGFYIAEQDLQIRGPGELLGSRQSGAIAFKVADLLRDNHMLQDVRSAAIELIAHQPRQARAIMARWMTRPEELGQV
ncbi:MAG: ATP-dependent DNA helicase RecG [Pseudomonadales bacterium]